MTSNKKVLFVTAKWPELTSSTDGGDSTTNEIIMSLRDNYNLDMLCFRNDIADGNSINGVRNIFFYQDDFALFGNYSLHNEEKFRVRIKQSRIARDEIRKRCNEYDFIVVQHDMFILSMHDDEDILEKTVLFPMFTGGSYLKCGEDVPEKYLDLEKAVLKKVRLIVTPSIVEKTMLVKEYGVPVDHIVIIPRPVQYKPSFMQMTSKDKVGLVYVASVRLQKNHLLAMKLVKRLVDEGIDAELQCVGAIQDEAIYSECLDYLKSHDLMSRVVFWGSQSREKLLEIMKKNDINISVSKWETFGRGIYEGMAYGLPTIVLDSLECVSGATNIGVYPIITDGIDHMAEEIIDLCNDENRYLHESLKGKQIGNLLNRAVVLDEIRKKYNEVFDN